uniref:Uncharacterized protein n=1 Tax=Hydatigena taeniaeformis TaxID=6205 RepID=A0A0R3WR04_HYDTA
LPRIQQHLTENINERRKSGITKAVYLTDLYANAKHEGIGGENKKLQDEKEEAPPDLTATMQSPSASMKSNTKPEILFLNSGDGKEDVKIEPTSNEPERAGIPSGGPNRKANHDPFVIAHFPYLTSNCYKLNLKRCDEEFAGTTLSPDSRSGIFGLQIQRSHMNNFVDGLDGKRAGGHNSSHSS